MGVFKVIEGIIKVKGASGTKVTSTTDSPKEHLDVAAIVTKWIGSSAPTVGQKAQASSIPTVLASNQSAVPIGPKDDLDNERIFSVTAHISMATAGVDNPLVLFRNPVSSGKTAYVISVCGGCAVANVSAVFGLYGGPTVSATGSALTPARRRIGSSTAPVVTPFSGPTVSANGTEHANGVQGQNSNTVELLNEDFVLAVPANTDLLITGRPGSNNRQAEITIVWIEK